MSPREKRIFHNEELFREVNAHIVQLEDRIRVSGELLSLLCECASTGCATLIQVERATFREVRKNPSRFLVAPGHERPDSETVVERNANYVIVEKHEPRREGS